MISFYPYYLNLKIKIFFTFIKEVGYFISLIAFAISFLFFYLAVSNISLLPNSHIALALFIFLIFYAIDQNRKDIVFLKTLTNRYKILLLFEYTLLSIPFFCFLIVTEKYRVIPIFYMLIALNTFLPRYKLKTIRLNMSSLIYPKDAFEWLSGLQRVWLWIFLNIVFIVVLIILANKIAILFAFTIFLITTATFYDLLENKYWIWVYPLSAKNFLFKKIKHIFKVGFGFWFIASILFLSIVGNLPLYALIILAYFTTISNICLIKYAYYQVALGVKIFQIIIIALGLATYTNPIFVIVQIFLFCYLFIKARNNLKLILC